MRSSFACLSKERMLHNNQVVLGTTPIASKGSVAGWSGDQEVWVEGQGRRARSQKFNRIDVGRFCFWKELEAQE